MPQLSANFAAPIRWDPIQGSLDHLRDTQAALAQFLEQLFRDLETGANRDASSDADLRRQIDELAADRLDFEHQLVRLQAENSRLSGTVGELADVRALLADGHAKGDDLRKQLAEATAAEQQGRAAMAAAELERRSLESELEALRRRSAELSQELADQKRQLAEERKVWNAELKNWRRLFEKQAALLSRNYRAAVPAAAGKRGRQASAAAVDDPVLNAVLAQFELLQTDLPEQDPLPTAPSQ